MVFRGQTPEADNSLSRLELASFVVATLLPIHLPPDPSPSPASSFGFDIFWATQFSRLEPQPAFLGHPWTEIEAFAFRYMAVVIPPSLKRNFDTWRRGSLAPYPVGSPEQHMGIMSYNYPPPPPPRSGAEIDVSISGVRPYFPQPPQPSQLPPQLPPPPQLATTPEQAADKKRNKLGYHRTSVACGHCRRRKIRFLSTIFEHGPPDETIWDGPVLSRQQDAI
ncbi:hypothetical protein P8C59_000297 [Phyllachora maydis]|uniref:Uncharacterized protein n=1 Tax=Phyllachora maydis TaxID=1825666 RepID=A0AAD9MA50_9PEZI|nr:hypothetical protein P8C59_000297 [Phyllachora maydis]